MIRIEGFGGKGGKVTGQYGYSGKILRVDLSSRSVTNVSTLDYADRFVGGRGIATKIYWDEVPSHIKAFAPENRLIIMTGPLGGLPGLSGSIWQIYGKSPATIPEQFCYCNLGGNWGANLKFAGYDGIVVQGMSENPVYLLIYDDIVEIRDASHLWGKSSIDVRGILKQELGDSVKIMATGPAGDNMVTFASVLAENDASGSSGFGAVMGSKKLKAIAVRGRHKITTARPEELRELTKYVRELNRDVQMVPVTVYAKIPEVTEKQYACYGCISGCARTIAETKDGKKSKRFCQSGCFYQNFVRDYYRGYNDVVIQAYRLCNQYGLDTRVVEAIANWISRCNALGILTDEGTGIPLSKAGSLEFIETLVRKIALREGFGDVLAEGPLRAARSVGRAAEEVIKAYASTAEGRAPAFDPRAYITTGIIHAMEPKQAMWQLNEIGKTMPHWVGWALKNTVPIDSYKSGQQHPLAHRLLIDDPEALKAAIAGCYVSSHVIRKIAKKFWGGEVAADFTTFEGKALAAKKIQDRSYAKECLVLCSIVWPNLHTVYSENHVGDSTIESKLLSAVTGRDIDPEGLDRIGEKVFNLNRAILVREGRKGRESDKLPEICFTAPLAIEAYNPECLVPGKCGEITSKKGVTLDKSQFEAMKEEYYWLRGWDIATGLQSSGKLEELGLGDIVDDLRQRELIK
ncbi:aldehyde ferredoxin oxidoreductase N-terminal domain-containing protein [Chloroflexota bacterium]